MGIRESCVYTPITEQTLPKHNPEHLTGTFRTYMSCLTFRCEENGDCIIDKRNTGG